MFKRKWYKISAENMVLGRLATRAARILTGKNKVDYIPHEDKGDFLIITHAGKVKVTGSKEKNKTYFRASRYPGNSKISTFEYEKKKDPTYIIYHAVKGMLPKNKLGARMLTRLKVYEGSEHQHLAQKPLDLEDTNG